MPPDPALQLVDSSASAPGTPEGAVEAEAPAEASPLLSAEEERVRGDELQGQLRDLILGHAAEKLRLRPKAVKMAKALIDWESVDADDQAAVERALGTLRREHNYLFKAAAGDIQAGARNYEGRDGWGGGGVAVGVDRIRAGYEENARRGYLTRYYE